MTETIHEQPASNAPLTPDIFSGIGDELLLLGAALLGLIYKFYIRKLIKNLMVRLVTQYNRGGERIKEIASQIGIITNADRVLIYSIRDKATRVVCSYVRPGVSFDLGLHTKHLKTEELRGHDPESFECFNIKGTDSFTYNQTSENAQEVCFHGLTFGGEEVGMVGLHYSSPRKPFGASQEATLDFLLTNAADLVSNIQEKETYLDEYFKILQNYRKSSD